MQLLLHSQGPFGKAVQPTFPEYLNFFLLKINIFLVFLDCFDALISKIIFKK